MGFVPHPNLRAEKSLFCWGSYLTPTYGLRATGCNVSNIYLILDNAKYFHAAKVRNWIDEHKKINIVFLPSYAPNLNLIERFWHFAKEKLVKNKYYKKYKEFRAKVFQFLNHTDDYIDEFKTLMVEKFEIIYA